MNTSFIPRKERHQGLKKKKTFQQSFIDTKKMDQTINDLLNKFSNKKKHTYTSRTEKNKKKFKLSFSQLLLIGFVILVISTPFFMS